VEPTEDILITFDEVTKRYADNTVAVDNLSLEMPGGRITVLVGPSGCGKTTSLRMINRMVDPSGGRILLDGTDIAGRSPTELRRGIGYVIQHAGLFPHRTIVDNIATVPLLLGWKRAAARERAMELMERVGLPSTLAKRYPAQLSGGQQQRVGVARALAADPPVMLMDEPFSAVDPVVRASLQEEFLRLQAELGKTIVFVTHDIDEAIKLGDQIAVMRQGGRLAQYAPPAELLTHPTDAFVHDFLGTDRGVRRLSFFSADGLTLRTDTMLPLEADAEALRAAAARNGDPWLLLVDATRRPVGWLDTRDGGVETWCAGRATDARVGDGGVAPAGLSSVGHGFLVGGDSLRTVLDAAVLSPSGRAVGLDAAGAVIGTIAQEDVANAIRAAHQAGAGPDDAAPDATAAAPAAAPLPEAGR
jgi:osmoprotectant transport system ATP-binding protein